MEATTLCQVYCMLATIGEPWILRFNGKNRSAYSAISLVKSDWIDDGKCEQSLSCFLGHIQTMGFSIGKKFIAVLQQKSEAYFHGFSLLCCGFFREVGCKADGYPTQFPCIIRVWKGTTVQIPFKCSGAVFSFFYVNANAESASESMWPYPMWTRP